MESKATKPISAEMFPGPGFRVKSDFHRLDFHFMEQFAEFATPDISDMLNRLYAMDPAISCLTGKHHRLCGPACTVKVFPGDNLMVHKSLDVAMPGDIVVIDAHASSMNAVLGDLVSTKSKHRGIAGFVVDSGIGLPNICTWYNVHRTAPPRARRDQLPHLLRWYRGESRRRHRRRRCRHRCYSAGNCVRSAEETA
jgi:hypothetical protein